MSRYYRIVITDPKSGDVFVPNFNGKSGFSRQKSNPNLSTYCSLNSGALVTTLGGTNPAAQTVELDLPVTYMHTPQQNSYLRVWGISLQEIGQAANLNGMNIVVYGGMAKGLPLANPSQAGILVSGQVKSAFGNWVNTDMTLDIYIWGAGSSPTSDQTTAIPSTYTTTPLPATNQTPANLIFQWEQGQPLTAALTNTLSVAYPKYKFVGAVNPNLVWTGPTETGYFATLPQLAQYVNDVSLKIVGGYAPNTLMYSGVVLILQNNIFTMTDGTTQTTPKKIAFTDLIGQPTWSQAYQVQATCVMRADINCGDYVILPPTPGIIQAGANSYNFNVPQGSAYANQSSGTIFNGTFQVNNIRHVGNSRQPAAQSWVTALDLVAQVLPSSTVSSYPVLYTGNNSYGFFLPGQSS